MPIIRCRRLRNLPRLVQRLQHLLRQRALLDILQIPLKLRLTANANNDAIVPAVLDIELRVVNDPSESRLQQSEIVLRDDRLDDGESLESGVFEVAFAVHSAAGAFCVREAAARWYVGCFVFSAEETAGYWVVDYDVEAVAAAGGD
jgi:hypothetical protein